MNKICEITHAFCIMIGYKYVSIVAGNPTEIVQILKSRNPPSEERALECVSVPEPIQDYKSETHKKSKSTLGEKRTLERHL